MLRGMGWKDEAKIGSDGKPLDPTKIDGPVLRPKGMGLGADKMIKAKPLLVQPAKGEVLSIRKGASIRVLSGKQKDLYGTVSTLTHFGFFLFRLCVYSIREPIRLAMWKYQHPDIEYCPLILSLCVTNN